MLLICKFLTKFVILSEAKDLLSCHCARQQVLRFAQDDNTALRNYSPASMRDLGSSRSRNASPIKLKASTANITVTAGKSTR
jgi:hypothetical protein